MTNRGPVKHLTLVREFHSAKSTSPEPNAERALATLRQFTRDNSPVPHRIRERRQRLRLLGATAAVLALPLLYVATVAIVATGLFLHATLNTSLLDAPSLRLFRAAGYVFPILAGLPLVLLLAKALVPRRRQPTSTRALSDEEQPHLFEFINTLSDYLGTPPPSEVVVDMELNAVARHDWHPFRGSRSRLTLGLPMVAGADIRSFAGIVARELGHLSRGSELWLTRVTHSINEWFVRVVHEPDNLDAAVERWRHSSGTLSSAAADFVGAFLLLARSLQETFLAASQTLTGYIVRHSEFQADSYEATLVGAEAFGKTLYRLRQLDSAASWVHQLTAYTYEHDIVPNNLPDFVARQTSSLSEGALNQLQEAIDEAETERLDTNLSDRERIIHAGEVADLVTDLELEGSARLLFRGFDQLCREATLSHYRATLDSEIGFHQLVPTNAVIQRYRTATDVAAALDRYFGNRLQKQDGRRPFFPAGDTVPPFSAETLSKLYKSRHRVKRHVPQAVKGYGQCSRAYSEVRELDRAALADELRFGDGEKSSDENRNGISGNPRNVEVDRILENASKPAEPFELAQSARLLHAIAALQHPTVKAKLPDNLARAQSARESLKALGALRDLSSWLETLELEFRSVEDLLDSSRFGSSETHRSRLSNRRFRAFARIPSAGHAACPIAAEPGQSVRDYLLAHRNDHDYESAGQVLGAYYHLHHALIGQLAVAADAVEAALALSPLDLDDGSTVSTGRSLRSTRLRKYRRRVGTAARLAVRA